MKNKNSLTTLEFDITPFLNNIEELRNLATSKSLFKSLLQEVFGDVHDLSIDVTFGNFVTTPSADGTIKIVQFINFGTHFETRLTTLRASKLKITHSSSCKCIKKSVL
jgi:hypothetical protein